jgi:hypothetical protein
MTMLSIWVLIASVAVQGAGFLPPTDTLAACAALYHDQSYHRLVDTTRDAYCAEYRVDTAYPVLVQAVRVSR